MACFIPMKTDDAARFKLPTFRSCFYISRVLLKVKVAVLGTGSLGKEHARIYAEMAAAGLVEFVGVFDPNTEAAKRVADKHRVRVFASVPEAAPAIELLQLSWNLLSSPLQDIDQLPCAFGIVECEECKRFAICSE